MSVESKRKRSTRRHKMRTHDGMVSSSKYVKTLNRGMLSKAKEA